MNLPRHSFFLAARLSEKPTLRIFVRISPAFALAALIFAVFALRSGSDAALGFFLVCVSTWILLRLLSRFVEYYQDTGIRRIESGSGSETDLPYDWPYFLEFSAAGFVSGLPDPFLPGDFVRGMFASAFGLFFFSRTGFDSRDFLSECEKILAASGESGKAMALPDLARKALESARKNDHPFVTRADFIAAFAGEVNAFSKFLSGRDVAVKDFDALEHWLDIIEEHRAQSFLSRLLNSSGIGKSWAYAYTPNLDRSSEDVSEQSEDELHIVAHQKEIREIEEALSRASHANVAIVGDPGVGKRSIVKGLAKRIREGKSFGGLNYHRVRELAMEAVISQQSVGGIEEFAGKVFREAEAAGNVILIINELDFYLAPGKATSIAELLMPFLRSPAIRIVGLSTPEGYARLTAANPLAASLFKEVRVSEPDEETVFEILEDVALALEKSAGIRVLYPAIKRVFRLASELLSGEPFPEKGVMLLEEAVAHARSLRSRTLTPLLVEQVLERKFGTVVGDVQKNERAVLLHLEDHLHRRVVNQAEAIGAIANAIRRKRAGVASGSKPVGTFLFLGPTGVGKTETAKALAEAYFGAEDRMIRFDMSEYQNSGDLPRLIGSSSENEAGRLAAEIRAHPFSLLLLDELEKADKAVLNLFLQILDEGYATDGFGKKIDFRNAIIIATSNAGAEFIRQAISDQKPYAEIKQALVDRVFKDRIFSPEFINRFDAVVVYAPLSSEHLASVARLQLEKLARRLEAQGYGLNWSQDVVWWLGEIGASPIFGGREIRRVIQDEVEAGIATEILAGKYKKGDTIHLHRDFREPVPPHLK